MIADATRHGDAELIRDLPAEVYHQKQLGVVTSGALKAALRSPAHYRAWVDAPERDSQALLFGRILHMFVFEESEFCSQVAIEDDWRGWSSDWDFGDLRLARRRWEMMHGHRPYSITRAEHEILVAVDRALRAHPMAKRVVGAPDAARESTIQWIDPQTGLFCQCRPDWWHRGINEVVDLKTCRSADARRFGYDVRDYGYDVSAAHYCAGIEALTGERPLWTWIAVEKEPPFAVACYSPDSLTEAEDARRRALQRIAEGIETGEWPAYPPGVEELPMPRRNWS